MGKAKGMKTKAPRRQRLARAEAAQEKTKAPRRRRLTRAEKEIEAAQKTTNNLVPLESVRRVLYETLQRIAGTGDGKRMKLESKALEILAEAAENLVVGNFRAAYLLTKHRKHKTLELEDMRVAQDVYAILDGAEPEARKPIPSAQPKRILLKDMFYWPEDEETVVIAPPPLEQAAPLELEIEVEAPSPKLRERKRATPAPKQKKTKAAKSSKKGKSSEKSKSSEKNKPAAPARKRKAAPLVEKESNKRPKIAEPLPKVVEPLLAVVQPIAQKEVEMELEKEVDVFTNDDEEEEEEDEEEEEEELEENSLSARLALLMERSKKATGHIEQEILYESAYEPLQRETVY